METHTKIRMEVLIEAPFKHRLVELLDGHGVSGYTVFSATAGRGEGSPRWARAGMISDVGKMLLFVCILDSERRDAVLEALFTQLTAHIGFVTTSEVQVIRPTKFP